MKPPNPFPVYASLYPIVAEIARTHGYALAMHGTGGRDFDLVAVPWTNEAAPCERLVAAFFDYFRSVIPLFGKQVECPYIKPEVKPHGRLAWMIPLGGDGLSLDLSVMPLENR